MGWKTKSIPVLSEQRLRWFWAKVDKRGDGECWNWTAYLNPNGYGEFSVGGGNRMAHRVAWFLEHGPIAQGMFICHSCDNPRCCNPAHLYAGTQKDNILDMTKKHRGAAKLNASQIPLIRQLKRDGWSIKKLGSRFGVNHGTISYIINRKTWRHVP